MAVRSVDILSHKEIKKLDSHYMDNQLFRIGMFAGIFMLVMMSMFVVV
ncbi:MAG: hypothetical protein U1E36_01725 [Rickettsiales bacterium]